MPHASHWKHWKTLPWLLTLLGAWLQCRPSLHVAIWCSLVVNWAGCYANTIDYRLNTPAWCCVGCRLFSPPPQKSTFGNYMRSLPTSYVICSCCIVCFAADYLLLLLLNLWPVHVRCQSLYFYCFCLSCCRVCFCSLFMFDIKLLHGQPAWWAVGFSGSPLPCLFTIFALL